MKAPTDKNLTPYTAASLWRDECLAQDGSMFGDGPVWNLGRLRELRSRLAQNSVEGLRSFEDKLQHLTAGSHWPPRLAAELLWVMMLFPTRKWMAPDRKRSLIHTVWGWGGDPLPTEHPLLGVPLESGTGGTGTTYNAQRLLELGYFIDAVIALKEGGGDEALRDPWAFAALLDAVPGGDRRILRHLLPHLLFPGYFEPIVAAASKRHIIEVFAAELGDFTRTATDPPLVELDRRLHHVAQRLGNRLGHPISFYRDAQIRERWDPSVETLAPLLSPSVGLLVVLMGQLQAGAGRKINVGLLALAALFHLVPDRVTGIAQETLDRGAGPGTTLSMLFQELGLPLPDPAKSPSTAPPDEEVRAPLADPRIRRLVAAGHLLAIEVSQHAGEQVIETHHLVSALLRKSDPQRLCALLHARGLDVIGAQRAMLAEMEQTNAGESNETWRRILGQETQSQDTRNPLARSQNPIQAGYSNDAILPGKLAAEHDLLDVMRDVEALCSVLVARDNTPPLSVGLFGDWGTGKSFFMELMWNHIEELARQSRFAGDTAYCKQVAQIRFNAWHYMDTNLWASLAARVFEGLAEYFEGNRDEKARRALFTELESSQGVLAEAERDRAAAEQRLNRIESRIRKVEDDLAAVAGATVTSVLEKLAGSADLQPRVAAAAKELGLDESTLTVTRLRESIQRFRGGAGRLRGRIGSLWRTRRWMLVIAVGAFLVLPLVAPRLLSVALSLLGVPDPGRTTEVIATGFGLVAGWATIFRPFLRRAAVAFKTLEEANRIVESTINQRELQAQRELLRLEEREREARARVEEIRRQIHEMRSGRWLHRFIVERATADDYRQHLGVVNLIRNDFEKLSSILLRGVQDVNEGMDAAPPGEGDNAAKTEPPRLDRIVLYIDDLDRCPEPRVVEVLQAVHLMLSFPLFVVVIGVDSRWLLLSLEDHYAALRRPSRRHRRSEHPELDTTPQNYLEKIFQIPFVLRPIDEAGFQRLVEHLVPVTGDESNDAKRRGEIPTHREVAKEIRLPGVAIQQNGDRKESGTEELDDEEWDEAEEPLDLRQRRPPLQLTPLALRVEPWERAFLAKLHVLIGSPRAAKRFANAYRFLRARLRDEELESFRGTEEGGGTHQAAALLLAAVVGHPQAAADLLGELHEEASDNEDWWSFLDRYESRPSGTAGEAERRRQLARLLRSLEGLLTTNRGASLEPYRFWSKEVARFSFQAGRLLRKR